MMRVRATTGGLAALLAALTLAACGDDSGSDPKAPRIPAAIAERLAALSDETAAAIELGDDCAAQEAADELEREALKAESQIPAELRGEVREGVQRLTASISCEPEPVTVIETVPEETTTEEKEESPCPPGQEKQEEHGKGEDDGKGKDKGEDKSGCKDAGRGEGNGEGEDSGGGD
jgi:hypothetical protein